MKNDARKSHTLGCAATQACSIHHVRWLTKSKTVAGDVWAKERIMVDEHRVAKPVVLALGANLCSAWGPPPASFARAIATLCCSGVTTISASRLYITKAVGPGLQDAYYNAVLVVSTQLPPSALLRLLKRVERAAGRRRGRIWGPRPLDIDIIDYKGHLRGRRSHRRLPGQLELPHPELHKRAFVLVPLADVLPRWRHPRFGLSVETLVKRLPPPVRKGVGTSLAFPLPPCEKGK